MSKMRCSNEDRLKRVGAAQERMFTREKNVLDKNMGTTLKAMDREYAELKKKQSQLEQQKSNTNLGDNIKAQSLRKSRSNLSTATSARQLQSMGGKKPEEDRSSDRAASRTKNSIPGLHPKQGHTEKPSKSVCSDVKDAKPGPSAPPESTKKANVKGKGKVSTVQDQSPRRTSIKDNGEQKCDQQQLPQPLQSQGPPQQQSEPSQRRESLTPADLIKHGVLPGRRGSTRRDSLTGQIFSREEMEEQQRILDLFIHLVEKVDDYVFDPAELSAKIKEMAIERKQQGATPISRASNSQRQAALPHLQRLHEDPALMKELQSLLHQRRRSVDLVRRSSVSTSGSSGAIHRHNGKRRVSGLDMLSDILGAYKSQYKEVKFDPLAMLNCGYLRLSKSNVRELERLCREQGIDPGIHAHTDVEDFQLFDDREDAEGEIRETAN